ncbi:MAG: hypothetical protein AB7G75_00370 [Candidatus Binatia bacterium]
MLRTVETQTSPSPRSKTLLVKLLRSIITTISALLVVVATTSVHAYTTRTQNGCNPITWASQPKVVLHTTEFAGPDFFQNLINLAQLTDAMNDIHEQFNLAGGTAAQVTGFDLSTDPFVYKTWFNDPTPTIHVGFTNNAAANPGGTFWNVDSACNIVEAHIQFQDLSAFGWTFSHPQAHGEPYYDVTLSNAAGDRYFRISYVHELLHAFGLSHSNDSYSMLNYGDRPWANRLQDDAVRPLPDDIEGLRALYPLAGSRYDIAVLNTWYDPVAPVGSYPAADQKQLCKPSRGSAWNSDLFADVCGVTQSGAAGSTTVASGNTLRTRFAVANYSTERVDVVASLYFSTDDIWDAADVASATTRSFSVSANGSSQQGRTWTVPSGLTAGDYYVIARVVATTPSGVIITDWIPLRGIVHVN